MPLFDSFSLSLNQFRPAHFPYARVGLTIALSIGAGWLFQRLNVPLPWMLGPMSICMLAVLLNVPVSAPSALRPPTTAIIGVMLGASFSPGIMAQMPKWAVTLALQTVLLVLLALVSLWFYKRVAKLDPITAYYAAMPGGMVEMSMIGEDRGGDGQAIILIHSARVMTLIATIPFLVQAIEHVSLGPRQASSLSVMDAPWQTFAWLIGTAVVGAFLGRWSGLPARYLFGPMFASIAVHVSGLTDFVMPREVVIGAQVMLGATTGCRFLGYDRRAILRILAQSIGATSLVIAVTFLFCLGLTRFVDIRLSQLLLALSPGGMSEMSLIAMALQFDIAFIIVHQLVRIATVAFCAPPLHRLLGWKPDS